VTAPYRDSAAAADDDQYRRVFTRKRLPLAASLCAGHAQQFGGESPPPNLMEVKG
jgi:hypothetical protein